MEKKIKSEETQGVKTENKTIQLSMSMMDEMRLNEKLYQMFSELVMEGVNSKMAFQMAKHLTKKEVEADDEVHK